MRTASGQADLARRQAEMDQIEAQIRSGQSYETAGHWRQELEARRLEMDMAEADMYSAKGRRTLALRDRVDPRHGGVRALMQRSAERDITRALRLLGEKVDMPEPIHERKVLPARLIMHNPR